MIRLKWFLLTFSCWRHVQIAFAADACTRWFVFLRWDQRSLRPDWAKSSVRPSWSLAQESKALVTFKRSLSDVLCNNLISFVTPPPLTTIVQQSGNAAISPSAPTTLVITFSNIENFGIQLESFLQKLNDCNQINFKAI